MNSGDKYFEERFKEIQEAYEILSDNSKRDLYDYKLKNHTSTNNNSNSRAYNKESEFEEREAKVREEQERVNKEKEQLKREKVHFQKTKEDFHKYQTEKSDKKRWGSGVWIFLVVVIIAFLGVIGINSTKNSNTTNSSPITSNTDNDKDTLLIRGHNKSTIGAERNESNQNIINNWANGSWLGKAYQLDIDESWDISLKCNIKEQNIIISYPSLHCGGSWEIINQAENRIEFREKIDYGNDVCVDNGKIILERKNDKVFYYYYLNNNTLNAKGQLFSAPNL